MKLMNPKHPVQANWIRELGLRLDARPFISGAMEARKTLAAISVRKEELRTLTTGHDGGIFNGPHFSRTYVESREHGVPFVGSGDMLSADLSNLPLLSKKDAYSPKLRYLELQPGTTLISCSGTIGRTVYCRDEMKGMWSSQHIMKVVPDESKVPPGYLYAFISSKYGIPIVISGTYGSIIQSIEPQHIATLPVPRFGKKLEQQVHDLVQEAGELRSSAGQHRNNLLSKVEQYIGWQRRPLHSHCTKTSSRLLSRRMDGFHHSEAVCQARIALSTHRDSVILDECIKEVFEPNRGARRKVDDRNFDVPFLSSSAVFRLDPVADYWISKKTPDLQRLLVRDHDLLLPRSGQLGGIIGRAVLPLPGNYGSAASEYLVRIRCNCQDDAFYLGAIFASQPGYYATIATAFGTSIPSLDCTLLSQLSVPWNRGPMRERLVTAIRQLVVDLAQAIELEREAIRFVESAIKGDA